MGRKRELRKRQPRKKVKKVATDKRCCIVNIIEESKLTKVEAFGHTIKVNKDIQENGNGSKWKLSEWYCKQREERKKYLNENFCKKPENYSHMHLSRKQPWYMLQKGKFFKYMEKREEWGTKTDYLKVDSEYKQMQKKYTPQKLGEAERLHKIEQEKIAKWEKKHPKPVKQGDLFEDQFLPKWKSEREQALERIRDFVVSAYGKKTKDKEKREKKHPSPITILDFREEKQLKYKEAA